jgi:hypothetical protein
LPDPGPNPAKTSGKRASRLNLRAGRAKNLYPCTVAASAAIASSSEDSPHSTIGMTPTLGKSVE